MVGSPEPVSRVRSASRGCTRLGAWHRCLLVEGVRLKDANCGFLGVHSKRELATLFDELIIKGLFSNDQERVPACLGGKLILPLVDELHALVAEKRRRFSLEGAQIIRAEVKKLLDCGIIRPSKPAWAAQVL